MKANYIIFFLLFISQNLVFSHLDTSREVYIVGISGGTGSGKSYVADKIKKTLGDQLIVLSEDFYYKDLSHLPLGEREKVNFDHPHAIDFSLLKEHILRLKDYQSISIPQYDFVTHSRKIQTLDISPKSIIIVEGILLLSIAEIRDLLDLKVFVDTDDDIRFLRRLVRDINERGRTVDSVCQQYLSSVYPMHQCFVKPSKRFADIVISGSCDNAIAVDILVSKLQKNTGPLTVFSQ